ncbi:MAG: efflux transporter outer membrane subunit [Planctomycetes bacterium]|nr:efflux transporter outer membrane subunit [Planctomycetota bacterium]
MASTIRHYLCSSLPCLLVLLCGCTTLSEYWHNGLKVGPNYQTPTAFPASDWIDPIDKRKDADDLTSWWKALKDPALDHLICTAYNQNLTLKQVGYRIMQARAQLGIAVGELFPQSQSATGSYVRTGASSLGSNAFTSRERFFSQYNVRLGMSWEIDFWGRYRRSVESARAELDASVADYDDALVTLLSDVASDYVLLRTIEKRIEYAKVNVEIQTDTKKIAEARRKVDKNSALAVDQAKTLLKQTEAGIPELEIALRQTNNRLCVLLGIPPEDLRVKLKAGAIPTPPMHLAVGIPADLLRRRPDLRRAERLAAAQSERIGIAKADFYPQIFLSGAFGYSAEQITDLFRSGAFNGNVGPSFRWNILNYGRIVNNVRLQDARFQELVAAYRNKVLVAQQEVENGLVTFANAHRRHKLQSESVESAKEAEKFSKGLWKVNNVDFTTLSLIQQNLVHQQDTLAQAQGEIAQGLIAVYRAIGGGWRLRCTDECTPPSAPRQAERPTELPPPRPVFGQPR